MLKIAQVTPLLFQVSCTVSSGVTSKTLACQIEGVAGLKDLKVLLRHYE